MDLSDLSAASLSSSGDGVVAPSSGVLGKVALPSVWVPLISGAAAAGEAAIVVRDSPTRVLIAVADEASITTAASSCAGDGGMTCSEAAGSASLALGPSSSSGTSDTANIAFGGAGCGSGGGGGGGG